VQRNGQPIRLTAGAASGREEGTPTMGGVLILPPDRFDLLWAELRNGYVWAVLLLTLGYGAPRLH